MKKFGRFAVSATVIAATLSMSVFALGDYSSADDPLITYSYIKDVLTPQLISQVKEAVIDALTQKGAVITQDAAMQVVFVDEGKSLIANGACEIVLRPGGTATVIASETNTQSGIGISDLTVGAELLAGENIPVNHSLLIPRGDGRGAKVTSGGGAYFMVRGDYSIE